MTERDIKFVVTYDDKSMDVMFPPEISQVCDLSNIILQDCDEPYVYLDRFKVDMVVCLRDWLKLVINSRPKTYMEDSIEVLKALMTKEERLFFTELVSNPANALEMMNMANYLQVPAFLAVASYFVHDAHIKGKTSDEIRTTFGLPDDIPPAEKQCP